jgi:hypothetical protein
MAAKEIVVEAVKMTDGRIVDFPGKRKMQKESFIDTASGAISTRFDYRNGETRTFVIPAAMVPKFAAHGMEQKYGDEAAGVEDLDDAILAIDELNERIQAGEWGVKREASGIAGTSVLLRAIVEVTGKPVDRVREYLKGKTQAQKLALRESGKFRDVVKRLEAEKAARKPAVDVAPLESEIDAI